MVDTNPVPEEYLTPQQRLEAYKEALKQQQAGQGKPNPNLFGKYAGLGVAGDLLGQLGQQMHMRRLLQAQAAQRKTDNSTAKAPSLGGDDSTPAPSTSPAPAPAGDSSGGGNPLSMVGNAMRSILSGGAQPQPPPAPVMQQDHTNMGLAPPPGMEPPAGNMNYLRNAPNLPPSSGQPVQAPPAPPPSTNLTDHIKDFEGYQSKAYPDGKQYSIGWGTKATSPNETIDPATANQRLTTEINHAADYVQQRAPNAPPGVKQALTSLTYNTGTAWGNSGLGKAIDAGDYDTARDHFLQYNRADGKFNAGLASRRAKEAAWFDNPLPSAATPPQSPADGVSSPSAVAPPGGAGPPLPSPPGQAQPMVPPAPQGAPPTLDNAVAGGGAGQPVAPSPFPQTGPASSPGSVPGAAGSPPNAPTGPAGGVKLAQATTPAAPQIGPDKAAIAQYNADKSRADRMIDSSDPSIHAQGLALSDELRKRLEIQHKSDPASGYDLEGNDIRGWSKSGFPRQETAPEKFSREKGIENELSGKLEQTKLNQKYFHSIYTGLTGSATIAAQQKQNIAALRDIAADPSFTSGVGGDAWLKMQRLGANLGLNTSNAAPREAFNMLAARVLADQFSGMKSMSSETGESASRIFKPMLDIEEKANITANDSLEGIKTKLNLLDRAGDLMIKWGDKADDYHQLHGGLDAGFNKEIRKEIAAARLTDEGKHVVEREPKGTPEAGMNQPTQYGASPASPASPAAPAPSMPAPKPVPTQPIAPSGAPAGPAASTGSVSQMPSAADAMAAQQAREAAADTMKKRVMNPQAFPTILAPLMGPAAAGAGGKGLASAGKTIFGGVHDANAAQWLARLMVGDKGGGLVYDHILKILKGE